VTTNVNTDTTTTTTTTGTTLSIPAGPSSVTGPVLYATMQSPVGEVTLSGVRSATAPGGIALASLKMGTWKASNRRDRDTGVEPGWVRAQEEFGHAIGQLEEYFRGERTEFDFEYAAHGTPFQERVWAALKKIPYGTTTTYGRITAGLGLDRVQARAVGGAVGSNPLGIVVPCHRVIGADGSLTGYAGGLANKETLLVLEGVLPKPFV
jgi:methylated-DNA-[protein]-cysteine S-methyltransferase